MPSLAERREDVAPLAAHFCEHTCARHRLPRLQLSAQLLEALATAEWPGNVRQLAHAVEAAAIRAVGAGVLQVEKEHMFPSAEPVPGNGAREPADGPPFAGDASAAAGANLTFQEATRRFQAQLLRGVLEETDWNVPEAATRLELARSYVYALMRGFGIQRRTDR
jgi:DNA-binding NtrC family response regulator